MQDIEGNNLILRRRAEALTTRVDLAQAGKMGAAEIQTLLHQLAVHQVELEMQNDELKKIQLELQASQNQFSQLYFNAPVGYLILDAQGIIRKSNQKFMQLVAREEKQVVGRTLSEFVRSEYRMEFDMWMKSRQRQAQSPNIGFAGNDKEPCYLSLSLTELNVTEYEKMTLVTATDVSALKNAKEKLRLSAAVFEAASEAALVTDAEHRIISVNPAFTRITGYSREEVLGKNPRILKSGKHDADFYRQFWHRLKTEKHWEGEIWNRRKDGEIYPEWLTVNVLDDAHGNPSYYVAVFSDDTLRKNAENIIKKQATYDTLTDLPNRMLFSDRLQQALATAKRDKARLAVIFIDLDDFKPINDKLGHPMGDLLLQKAAKRMQDCVRESDTVARFGGDEFVVLLPAIETQQDAKIVADKICGAINQPFELPGKSVNVSSSIGIAVYPENGSEEKVLLKNADTAMYYAKESGRNTVRFFPVAKQEKSKQQKPSEGKRERGLKR